MIHTDFDPEKTAVIEPSEFYHPMENMPEALIGVFSRPLTENTRRNFTAKSSCNIRTATVENRSIAALRRTAPRLR